MENLNQEKFECLSTKELSKIEGGKWHVECRTFEGGSTWHCAYRDRLFGDREWGTPQVD